MVAQSLAESFLVSGTVVHSPMQAWLFCFDRFALAWLVAWSLLLNSLPAHKEFRFLLPALQLLMPYAGAAVARLVEALSADAQHCGQGASSAKTICGASLSADPISCGAVADDLDSDGHGACRKDGGDHSAAGNVICDMLPQWPSASAEKPVPGPMRQRSARSSGAAAAQGAMPQSGSASRRQPNRRRRRGRRRSLLLATAAAVSLCLVAQLPAAAYFCLVHQR